MRSGLSTVWHRFQGAFPGACRGGRGAAGESQASRRCRAVHRGVPGRMLQDRKAPVCAFIAKSTRDPIDRAKVAATAARPAACGLGLERDDLFAGVPRVFRKPPCGTPARGLFEGRTGRGAGRQTSAAESGDPPGPVVRLDPVAGQRSPVHGLHPRGRVLFARLDEEDGPGLRRAEIRGPVHRAPERTEMRAVRAFWPRPAGRRTSRRCRLPGPQEPPGRIDAPVTVIRNLTCAPRRATLVSHANPGTGSSAEQKAHGNPRSILAGADVCIRCGLAGLLHGFRRNRQMVCSHSRRMNVRRSPGPRPSPAAVEPVHEQPRQTDRQIENRSAPVPVARRVKIARRFRLGLECRSTFSTGVTLDERVPSNTPAHDHVPGGETADCPRIWLRGLVAL